MTSPLSKLRTYSRPTNGSAWVREAERIVDLFETQSTQLSLCISAIERLGHTNHCAHRLAFGDGECECPSRPVDAAGREDADEELTTRDATGRVWHLVPQYGHPGVVHAFTDNEEDGEVMPLEVARLLEVVEIGWHGRRPDGRVLPTDSFPREDTPIIPPGAEEFESDGMRALRFIGNDEGREQQVRVTGIDTYELFVECRNPWWDKYEGQSLAADDIDAPAHNWLRSVWAEMREKPLPRADEQISLSLKDAREMALKIGEEADERLADERRADEPLERGVGHLETTGKVADSLGVNPEADREVGKMLTAQEGEIENDIVAGFARAREMLKQAGISVAPSNWEDETPEGRISYAVDWGNGADETAVSAIRRNSDGTAMVMAVETGEKACAVVAFLKACGIGVVEDATAVEPSETEPSAKDSLTAEAGAKRDALEMLDEYVERDGAVLFPYDAIGDLRAERAQHAEEIARLKVENEELRDKLRRCRIRASLWKRSARELRRIRIDTMRICAELVSKLEHQRDEATARAEKAEARVRELGEQVNKYENDIDELESEVNRRTKAFTEASATHEELVCRPLRDEVTRLTAALEDRLTVPVWRDAPKNNQCTEDGFYWVKFDTGPHLARYKAGQDFGMLIYAIAGPIAITEPRDPLPVAIPESGEEPRK